MKAQIVSVLVLVLLFAAMAHSTTTTITVLPGDVPDEQLPRINSGDAPAGFGADSWQGPASGKSNWHARYLADGDSLSILFPTDAPSLKISDLASISYFTKRLDGTAAGRDWWVQIYTRKDGVNDKSSWYGYKFTNNYNDHTATGAWTQYSTDSGMTFNVDGSSTEYNLADLGNSAYGSELVEMISIQTNSTWPGFNGYMDGLVITLDNGNVGRVNFEGVPEPATMCLLGLGAMLFAGKRK